MNSTGMHPSRARRQANRRGITLLEALFAIFVSAIGILSLAALIPAGKFMIGQAERSDRGSAIAEAAMQEFISRSMLQVYSAYEASQLASGSLPYRDTIVIDPWLLSHDATTSNTISSFPYDSSATTANYYGPGTPPRLPRLTPFTGLLNPAHREAADRVFSSHDDVTFSEPSRPEARPQAFVTTAAASAYQGDYCWLATVTPAQSQRYNPPITGTSLGNQTIKTMFNVQVAIFHKRELSPLSNKESSPSERIVLADRIGNTDVRLRTASTVDDKFLKLRPDQWIMMVGYSATGGPINPITTTYYDPAVTTSMGTGLNQLVARWYRLVGLGDITTETIGGTDYKVRYVTLAGPDWGDPAQVLYDTDGNGLGDAPYDADNDTANGYTLHAYLFHDCVNVQEKTIKFDLSAMSGY